MVSRRTVAWIAWALAFATTFVVIFDVIQGARSGAFVGSPAAILEQVIWNVIAAVFGLLAALIITKQPGNVVGWLLMTLPIGILIAAVGSLRLDSLESAPTTVDPGLFLAIWFNSWSWVLLIFPLFHLFQVFPTGRILTRRWRWLMGLELVMATLFIGLVTFSRRMEVLDGDWTIENPIGFISEDLFDRWFSVPWTIGLLILTVGGATSTIVRYRRSQGIERQQIKWLLYAFGLFAVVYSLTASFSDKNVPILQALFPVSVAAIPAAITVAVLRYRLFDIDLIIRRTLVYGVLTGLLALVYLGSVVALQSVFRGEQNSSVSVAGSTLLITALFTPLRRRIQTLIDRRLFRSKYNAQKVIERFGGAAQNQANLETLSADLMAVIQETIQPRFGGLWIRELT